MYFSTSFVLQNSFDRLPLSEPDRTIAIAIHRIHWYNLRRRKSYGPTSHTNDFWKANTFAAASVSTSDIIIGASRKRKVWMLCRHFRFRSKNMRCTNVLAHKICMRIRTALTALTAHTGARCLCAGKHIGDEDQVQGWHHLSCGFSVVVYCYTLHKLGARPSLTVRVCGKKEASLRRSHFALCVKWLVASATHCCSLYYYKLYPHVRNRKTPRFTIFTKFCFVRLVRLHFYGLVDCFPFCTKVSFVRFFLGLLRNCAKLNDYEWSHKMHAIRMISTTTVPG